MVSGLKYYAQLLRLKNGLRKAYALDDRLIKEAIAKGTKGNALDDFKHELVMENWIDEDELAQLQTRHVCRAARRYRVPVPPHSDAEMWEQSYNIGGWQLTDAGYAKLRADIRKEKNDRWQFWELRIKVLTTLAVALTGAFGAAIGLIATWHK